jgi:hypothetical protein
MAADATPGGINIRETATSRLSPQIAPWSSLEPAHAARLLEHVRTWQRRLQEAVDRYHDARAYYVAHELHDVVDRASADLVRVFGDVGLRAPVEAFDGPRPRRGPLGMNVLHAPHSARDPIATSDPDIAVSALTSWSTWLEDRAAAKPATGEAAANQERPRDDPRLDEYRPATYFRLSGTDVAGRLRQAKRANGWPDRKNERGENLYRIRDVVELLTLTSQHLDAFDEAYTRRMLKT